MLPVQGLTDRRRMDILYIVIPAYNEEANIGDVIASWYPIIEKHNGGGQSRLVIIDDGSRDCTLEIMQEAAKTRPLLVPLTKENKGHGATVLYGYKYALREGADFIFQTDSDGQTLPEEFEPFWERRNEYDLIAGWRRGRQDGFSRKVITTVLRGTVKLTFGLDLRDVNVPYRLMKAETLRKWIGLVPPDFNLTNIAVMAIFGKVGARILSIPVTFRPRQGGKSTVNVRKIGGIGVQALRDFRKLNRAIDRAIEYRDIE
jgi:glycosyltransferase involved in cell wall biosynthesis